MNKNYFLSCFLALIFCFSASWSQPVTLTLEEAIRMARQSSPDYRQAVNQAEASYWMFRNYRSRFLPQLSLYSTLPDYSTSIERITNPDGTESFVRQNRSFYSLDLGLRQNVPLTGGTFSVRSNLERLDILSTPRTTDYYSEPFAISYTQNSLFYNPFRWQSEIEPLRYESSQRQFVENMEEISLETIRQYFNLLAAQVQLRTAELNFANTDTLYK
ncbi:MAG TPA: TolC family protein, partial [Anseongella sp.]|nr:TolC family protein [Anseongella sp.]